MKTRTKTEVPKKKKFEALFDAVDFDVATMDIKYLTKDSKKGFSLLAGINRPIIPGHVTKMCDAIKLMKRVIRPVVVARLKFIEGVEKNYIIDGQHLYNGLLRMNCKIPYVMVDIASKQELIEVIAKCNATSRSWSLNDYITAWSSIKSDYVTLNQLIKTYNLEARTIVSCYMPSYGKSASTIIKKGQFKIEDKVEGDKLINQLTDCLSVITRRTSLWDIERFTNAALKVMRTTRSYNHTTFMNYLKKNKRKLDVLLADQTEIFDFMNMAFKKK